jgi:hypothetical protein
MSCWFQETAGSVWTLNLTTFKAPPPLFLEAYSIWCSCTPTQLQAMDRSITNRTCAQLNLVLYSTGRFELLLPRTFHSKQSRLERIKLPAPTKPCQRKGKPFGTESDNVTVSHKTAPVTSGNVWSVCASEWKTMDVEMITVRRYT